MKRTKKMRENGHRISGKTIIGIDPAKNKHQAVILGPDGSVCGRRDRKSTRLNSSH